MKIYWHVVKVIRESNGHGYDVFSDSIMNRFDYPLGPQKPFKVGTKNVMQWSKMIQNYRAFQRYTLPNRCLHGIDLGEYRFIIYSPAPSPAGGPKFPKKKNFKIRGMYS